MICYRDMTFCVTKSCTNKCGRKLTEEIIEGAKRWGGENAPISMAYICKDEGDA